MKKGKYYFNKLSKKEQIEFKENCNTLRNPEHLDNLINEDFNSFELFLSRGFVWGQSLQGLKYWIDISNRKIN